MLTSCMILTPIVKPAKFYAPRNNPADVVDYIPNGTIYIGTVKIVPGDDAFIRSERRKRKAIRRLQAEAAKAGADYVVITDVQKTNRDYFIDAAFSDGYTIETEMFRKIKQ